MKTINAIVVCLVLIVAGCASTSEQSISTSSSTSNIQRADIPENRFRWTDSPDRIKWKVREYNDPYSKQIRIVGPKHEDMFLRAFKTEHNFHFQLYVISKHVRDYKDNDGHGFIDFEYAYDSQGVDLELRKIDSSVDYNKGHSVYTEEIIISFPETYLTLHATKGINIKIFGKRQNSICKIPPYYIQGFLSKIDELYGTEFYSHPDNMQTNSPQATLNLK